mmetsp:Transcript_34032/g.101093  ORF Transcript_34032/g.101093 Transcript_34032/m.101093 type:complete len:336 (-) Transcript_34032:752-1759(-)
MTSPDSDVGDVGETVGHGERSREPGLSRKRKSWPMAPWSPPTRSEKSWLKRTSSQVTFARPVGCEALHARGSLSMVICAMAASRMVLVACATAAVCGAAFVRPSRKARITSGAAMESAAAASSANARTRSPQWRAVKLGSSVIPWRAASARKRPCQPLGPCRMGSFARAAKTHANSWGESRGRSSQQTGSRASSASLTCGVFWTSSPIACWRSKAQSRLAIPWGCVCQTASEDERHRAAATKKPSKRTCSRESAQAAMDSSWWILKDGSCCTTSLPMSRRTLAFGLTPAVARLQSMFTSSTGLTMETASASCCRRPAKPSARRCRSPALCCCEVT